MSGFISTGCELWGLWLIPLLSEPQLQWRHMTFLQLLHHIHQAFNFLWGPGLPCGDKENISEPCGSEGWGRNQQPWARTEGGWGQTSRHRCPAPRLEVETAREINRVPSRSAFTKGKWPCRSPFTEAQVQEGMHSHRCYCPTPTVKEKKGGREETGNRESETTATGDSIIDSSVLEIFFLKPHKEERSLRCRMYAYRI